MYKKADVDDGIYEVVGAHNSNCSMEIEDCKGIEWTMSGKNGLSDGPWAGVMPNKLVVNEIADSSQSKGGSDMSIDHMVREVTELKCLEVIAPGRQSLISGTGTSEPIGIEVEVNLLKGMPFKYPDKLSAPQFKAQLNEEASMEINLDEALKFSPKPPIYFDLPELRAFRKSARRLDKFVLFSLINLVCY